MAQTVSQPAVYANGLIGDISLCFNIHNKTISLLRQEHNNSTWYWYLTTATSTGIQKWPHYAYILNTTS